MARRYIIVGTGAAGLAAAETIRDKDPQGNLMFIGDDPFGFYSRPGLAYYLTGEACERQLYLRQASGFLHVKARVAAVQPEAHQVTTEDGRTYAYDKLLLATGSVASKIANPGAELEGVVKLDNLTDAKQMVRIARKGKTAVVVGGGIIALEIVEGLRALGMETHYLLRGDRYWSNVLDEIESTIVENRLKQHGVRIHYETQLACIEGKDGKVAGVETDKGEKIKCQLLAVGIGVQPRMELAKTAGLRTDRGILTDEYLQTSAQDIFAAGDVAQVLDTASGKAGLDTLWGTALSHGHAAGRNMAGEHTPYRKAIAFNVTRLAGLTTTIIGAVGQPKKDDDLLSISRGDSETWRQLPNVMAVQWDFEVNRTRIMAGQNTFVGAVVMGDQTLSRPLHQLIAHRADITPIRADLSLSHVRFADRINEFWLEWSRSHETAQQ